MLHLLDIKPIDEKNKKARFYKIVPKPEADTFYISSGNLSVYFEIGMLKNCILDKDYKNDDYQVTIKIIRNIAFGLFDNEQLLLRQLFVGRQNSNSAFKNRDAIKRKFNEVQNNILGINEFINFIHSYFPDLCTFIHLYPYIDFVEIDKKEHHPRMVGTLKGEDLNSLDNDEAIGYDNTECLEVVKMLYNWLVTFKPELKPGFESKVK